MSRTKRKLSAKRKRQQLGQAKNQPAPDFEKKRQRLGAKRRPDNFTDTTVSTRQIHVPNQQRSTPTPTPALCSKHILRDTAAFSLHSQTGYTLPELLGRATHHNVQTRLSALNALYNGIFNANAVCHDAVHARAPAVISVSSVAMTDDNLNVRKSAINLLLSPLLKAPLLPVAAAQTMAALTHLRKDVQFSAVEMIPRLMGRGEAVVKVMPHSPLDPLMKMFSYVTSVKRKIQVLDAIAAVVKNMVRDELVKGSDDDDMDENYEFEDDGKANGRGNDINHMPSEEENDNDDNDDDNDDEDDEDEDEDDDDEPMYFFHRPGDGNQLDRELYEPISASNSGNATDLDVFDSGLNTLTVSVSQWTKLLRLVCATLSGSVLEKDDADEDGNGSDETLLKSGLEALQVILSCTPYILLPSPSTSLSDTNTRTRTPRGCESVPNCVPRILRGCAEYVVAKDEKHKRRSAASAKVVCIGLLADCALSIGDIELCATLLADYVDDIGTSIDAVKRLLRVQYAKTKRSLRPWSTFDRVDVVVDRVINTFVDCFERREDTKKKRRKGDGDSALRTALKMIPAVTLAVKWAVLKRMPCAKSVINVLPKAIRLAIWTSFGEKKRLRVDGKLEEEEEEEEEEENKDSGKQGKQKVDVDNDNDIGDDDDDDDDSDYIDEEDDAREEETIEDDAQIGKETTFVRGPAQGIARSNDSRRRPTNYQTNICATARARRALSRRGTVALTSLAMLLCRLHEHLLLLGRHVSDIGMDELDATTVRCGGMVDALLRELLDKDINTGMCEEAAQHVGWMVYYSGRVLSAECRHAITVGFQPDNRGRNGGRLPPSSHVSTALMDALEWVGTSGTMGVALPSARAREDANGNISVMQAGGKRGEITLMCNLMLLHRSREPPKLSDKEMAERKVARAKKAQAAAQSAMNHTDGKGDPESTGSKWPWPWPWPQDEDGDETGGDDDDEGNGAKQRPQRCAYAQDMDGLVTDLGTVGVDPVVEQVKRVKWTWDDELLRMSAVMGRLEDEGRGYLDWKQAAARPTVNEPAIVERWRMHEIRRSRMRRKYPRYGMRKMK